MVVYLSRESRSFIQVPLVFHNHLTFSWKDVFDVVLFICLILRISLSLSDNIATCFCGKFIFLFCGNGGGLISLAVINSVFFFSRHCDAEKRIAHVPYELLLLLQEHHGDDLRMLFDN